MSLARSNVATVICIHMNSNFLEKWRGPMSHDGTQEKWKPASATSLSDNKKQSLRNGGAFFKRPKGTSMTKVFVCDDVGIFWSVIVPNYILDELEDDLKTNGWSRDASVDELEDDLETIGWSRICDAQTTSSWKDKKSQLSDYEVSFVMMVLGLFFI